MSHANLLVAITTEDIKDHGGIEEAIGFQMGPFCENDEWLADGSRWDWWQIGGRFTGQLSLVEYDPAKDPDNIELCWLCNGTGTRTDMMVVANGCNGCRGTGHKTKWPTEWKDVGNVSTRAKAAPLENRLAAYAFLKDRAWHETGRLGFFGCQTATECEIKAEEAGETFEGRCIHRDEKTGAKIVSYGNENGRWNELFWARFIRNLIGDTTLVVVDYHV